MKRLHLVEELFTLTAGLDAETRARVVRERVGDDVELARQIEALARADSEPHDVFDRTATDLLFELEDAPAADELCGARFGPYRVDAHLSSGGMGHVYRATHTSAGIERRVALKVLRHGLDTRAFLARFQRERAALAALEHEHIVRFLDAGALPDGRPYLVMEYVDGVPLTEWASGRGLATREIVELFLAVLGAVQYAHQKLVIHRDLKPSNVLVGAAGAPKLLDFGVASVLEEGHALVSAARVPFTPDYASPEQLAGESVATASDVYALGVILHELLASRLPDRDPESGECARASTVAETPRLARALRGDLDAIIARALAPEPARRYPSADRFADDLRRYLAHQPVEARSEQWPYRAARFVRRNRWPLVSATAVVMALVAGWIASDLNRRRAERDSSVGWGAHAAARHTAYVFEDWITGVAAGDAQARAGAIAHFESTLVGELRPETETLVRLALAQLFLQDSELDRAQSELDRALALFETTRGLGQGDRRRAEELRAAIEGAR